MEVSRLIRGRALYTTKDKIWVAQGMTFFAIDYNGKCVSRKYKLGSILQRIISMSRYSRQLLRQGLHHLVILPNGDFFVTAKGISYVVSSDGRIKHTFSGYRGNKPAHQGVCVTPEGTILFGEYTLNPQRDHDTRLYRSIDGGKTFEVVLTLKANEVRHIHFVKYDPYEKCLWLGTGDKDFENCLYRSLDNGDTWDKIGGGTQDWRAIGVCFNEQSLIWGTDAGSVPDQNHIIQMNRRSHVLEIIANAEGPCHGCASLNDGRVFISTGVEGGENEKDRYARLKLICNDQVLDVAQYEKDKWPMILQFGVIRFPLGLENSKHLVFTTMGLRCGGEMVMIYK